MPSSAPLSKNLQTSTFERVASVIIALLGLLGLTVGLLFAIWFSASFFPPKEIAAVQVEPFEGPTDLDDNAEYDPNVTDPGMQTEFDQPTLQNSLQTITDVVAAESSLFSDSSDFDANSLLPGGRKGDGRTAKRPGRKRHWEFLFPEGNTVSQYARQLDYFGIELGVLLPGGQVAYASNLSQPQPTTRTEPSEAEKRYYLTWLKGELENADRTLLSKAGIDHQDKLILKFLPPELEQKLVNLENARAGDKKDRIQATFFSIRPQGSSKDAYDFFVAEQMYQ